MGPKAKHPGALGFCSGGKEAPERQAWNLLHLPPGEALGKAEVASLCSPECQSSDQSRVQQDM